MKRPARFFWFLALFLIVVSSSNAQSKIRKLEDADQVRTNLPIAIVSRKVANSIVAEDGTFKAEPSWLKSLTLTLKNISEKSIRFIQIDLIVNEGMLGEDEVQIPIRFGVPFWMDESGKVHSSDRDQLLFPKDTTEVSVTERDADAFTKLLNKDKPQNLTQIRIQIREIQFDDDTGWSLGHEWSRDPKNRNRRLPIEKEMGQSCNLAILV